VVVSVATAIVVFVVGDDWRSAVAAGVAGLVALVFVTLPVRAARLAAELRAASSEVRSQWVALVATLADETETPAAAIEAMLSPGVVVSVAAGLRVKVATGKATMADRQLAVELLRGSEAVALHPLCEGDLQTLRASRQELKTAICTDRCDKQSLLNKGGDLTVKTLHAAKAVALPEVTYD
jgi:hypothetical protein